MSRQKLPNISRRRRSKSWKKGPMLNKHRCRFFPSNWPLLVVREALAPPRFNELIPQTYLKGDTFAKLYFFGYLCEISRGLRILISKMTWRTRGWKIFDRMMTSMTEWRNYRTWKWWYTHITLRYTSFNIAPENGLPKGKVVFQPSILVSGRVCKIMSILHTVSIDVYMYIYKLVIIDINRYHVFVFCWDL